MNRNYVDGPGFVAWLRQVRPEDMSAMEHTLGDTDYRAISRANAGGAMKVDTADRICCKLFLHIDSEMPEELWVPDPKIGKSGPRTTPERVEKVRALLAEGLTPNRVGTALGMSPHTVRKIMAGTLAYEGLDFDGDKAWNRRAA